MTTGSGLVYIIDKAKYNVVCVAQPFFELILGISKRRTFSFTGKLKKRVTHISTISSIYIMVAMAVMYIRTMATEK
jgi:hypothetical protein